MIVPRSVEDTFAFVSDFRNAALWDPRTYSVVKTTEGPIGVGTRFMLTGGMLPGSVLRRLHLSEGLIGMALPYDVVEFDPPHEFALEGESRMVRYRDHLGFSDHNGSTQLVYFAELELKGAPAFMDGMLQKTFTRIGDGATADIASTVVGGT